MSRLAKVYPLSNTRRFTNHTAAMLKKSLLAAALLLASLQGLAAELPSYPFIHARGTAFVYVQPDLGEIDFDLSAYDPAPEKALAVVQERIAEIKALMAQQGQADADIEVRDIRRQLRKSDGPEPQYDIRCMVHLTVRDLAKWRDVMLPLLGMANLDGFATTFGVTRRTEVEGELMASAVREAQAKADSIARGFGKRAGAVAGVSSDELKNITRAVGLMPSDWPRNSGSAGRTKQDAADLLMVSALKMSQSVDAIFRFK